MNLGILSLRLVIAGLSFPLPLLLMHSDVDPWAGVGVRIGHLRALGRQNYLSDYLSGGCLLSSDLIQISVVVLPGQRRELCLAGTVPPKPTRDPILLSEDTAIVKCDGHSHQIERVVFLGALENLHADLLIFWKLSAAAEVVECRRKCDNSSPATHCPRQTAVSPITNSNSKSKLTHMPTHVPSHVDFDP